MTDRATIRHDATRERAALTDLTAAVTKLLPALEQFLRFEGPDGARDRATWQAKLERPLPQRGAGADAVIETLARVVIPAGLRIGAPGFCGWVTTMPTIVPAAANLASTIAAPQKWWASSGNFLEALALRWLRELLGLTDRFTGAFVSGGAMANFLCLATARQHAGEARGIDPAADGVHALNKPRLYCTDHVHHVMLRALGMLGLGRRSLVRIAQDKKRGPDIAALDSMIRDDIAAGCTPIAVVASAGDVNTGVVDPIDAMREVAHAHGVWLHVDGAYGGFGVLDPRVRQLYGDLNAIDSLAIDPHKWLAAPIGCGAGFVRDSGLLERAFALEPSPYVDVKRGTDVADSERSIFDVLGLGNPDHSMEHSAPSRGIAVWAILAEIGADGMRARVARHLDCARHVAQRVESHPDLELLAEPVLSICCFRYHPPAIRDSGTLEGLNRNIIAAVRARGRATPSSTRVNNKLAIRPCFIGPATGLDEANALVDEVLAVASTLRS